jgi:hypothetical protein
VRPALPSPRRTLTRGRAYLAENYHFDCSCPVCALPPPESAASDARLSALSAAYDAFAAWGTGALSSADAGDVARRIWALADAAGYLSERGQLAADAAHVAAAASECAVPLSLCRLGMLTGGGSEEATKAWAARAAEWFGYELGADSAQVREMRALAEKPRSHPARATPTPDPEA